MNPVLKFLLPTLGSFIAGLIIAIVGGVIWYLSTYVTWMNESLAKFIKTVGVLTVLGGLLYMFAVSWITKILSSVNSIVVAVAISLVIAVGIFIFSKPKKKGKKR